MMFRSKKILQSIESVDRAVTQNYNFHRDEYWKLFHELESLKKELAILVESLGLSRYETHKVGYIKKDGPEQP